MRKNGLFPARMLNKWEPIIKVQVPNQIINSPGTQHTEDEKNQSDPHADLPHFHRLDKLPAARHRGLVNTEAG